MLLNYCLWKYYMRLFFKEKVVTYHHIKYSKIWENMDQWKPVFSHILRNLRCGKMKNWKNLKNTYSCKQSLNLFGVIFIVIPNQGRHYYYKTEQNSYKSGQLLQITTTLLQITTVITQIKAIIINRCSSHLKNWFCFSVCH